MIRHILRATSDSAFDTDQPLIDGRALEYAQRAAALVWSTSRSLALSIATLTIVSGVTPAAMAYIGALIVDGVVAASDAAKATGTPDFSYVIELVIAEALLVALMAVANRAMSMCQQLLRDRLGHRVNVMVLEKALSLELVRELRGLGIGLLGSATQLGRWFNDGRELSGGQWQKIALSRAFMRSDADIVVLDEPTAAMDAAAEADIFEHFRALMRERIAILISHRFSTVRMADQIVVLEQGRLVERGSHQELMQLRGRYARLFSLQARGYH